MCVLRKMRAIAGVLLLSPGLSLAADQAPAVPSPQAIPDQSVPDMPPAMMPPVQPWPQMMPFPGMPSYYWAPPQGMMWPMPSPYPAPMAMPTVPSVPWVPVMWVMVPVPAETPGVAEPHIPPVANIPVVTPPNETAPVSDSGVVPTQEAMYVPVAPTPVVKLPVPDAAPEAPPADAGKVMLDQAVSPVEVAAPAPSGPVVALAEAADFAIPVSLEGALSTVTVDYGPVAPTPVVDLLALMQPDSPVVKKPARLKKPRKTSVAIPLKPRPTATAKPVKQRMCWTQGVVAPCR